MPQARTPFFSEILSRLQLSPDSGTVEKFFSANSERFVILIQDAHAAAGAQKSILDLVQYFQKRHNVRLAALEGASGKLDPALFRAFPDKASLGKVFFKYLDRGELSGAAAASVLSDVESAYYGIEDQGLYEKTVDSFLRALRSRRHILEDLERIEQELFRLKKKYYHPRLREFDRKKALFENHKLPMAGFLLFLEKTAERQKVSGWRRKYPHVNAVLEAARKDFLRGEGKLETEIRMLAGKIRGLLAGEDELRRFHGMRQSYETERISAQTFLVYLDGLIRQKHLHLKPSKGLLKSMHRARTLENMKGAVFFRETDSFVRTLKKSLIRTPAERHIDVLSGQLALRQRLVRMELSREDWARLRMENSKKGKSQSAGFGFYQKIREEPAWNLNHALWRHHEDFYRQVIKREKSFLKNLFHLMDRANENGAIMVLGGFHTGGILNRLREENISYLLITPNLRSETEKAKPSLYLKSMTGEVSWKNYFRIKNGRIDLYEAFCKAAVDRLISGLHPGGLKLWREALIRSLAASRRLADFPLYSRFIDEAAYKLMDESKKERFKNAWLEKVGGFIAGLRELKEKNQLTQTNIFQMMNQKTATPWTQIPLARARVPASWAAGPSGGAGFSRNETRAKALKASKAAEEWAFKLRSPDELRNDFEKIYKKAGVTRRTSSEETQKGIHLPSPARIAYEIMEEIDIPEDRPFFLVDAGSGQGEFSLRLASLFPNMKIAGIEDDKILSSESRALLRAAEDAGLIKKGQVEFYEGDYNDPHFSHFIQRADLVYYYALGTNRPYHLAETLVKNLKPGARIIESGHNQLQSHFERQGAGFNTHPVHSYLRIHAPRSEQRKLPLISWFGKHGPSRNHVPQPPRARPGVSQWKPSNDKKVPWQLRAAALLYGLLLDRFVKIEGLDHELKEVFRTQPVILVGNHMSLVDVILVFAIFNRTGRWPLFVAETKDLGRVVNWLIDHGAALKILKKPGERGGTSKAMREQLKKGRLVGIWPSDHAERYPGQVFEPRKGSQDPWHKTFAWVSVDLAKETDGAVQPVIVPMSISGWAPLIFSKKYQYNFLKELMMKGLHAEPFRLHITFGKPIQARDYDQVFEEAMNQTASLLDGKYLNGKKFEIEKHGPASRQKKSNSRAAPRSELRNKSESNGLTLKWIDNLADAVIRERQRAYNEATKWATAVAVYGSARIPPDHAYYELGMELGKMLWDYRMPPRTGAGLSLMEAPLRGFREARGKKIQGFPTQGIRIKLPFEARTTPHIEVGNGKVIPYEYFLIRKIALHENIFGVVALPGGFGTLDEVFETWRRHRPLVLLNETFWSPLIKAYYQSFEEAGLLESVTNRPLITSSPKTALQYIREESEKNPPYKPDRLNLNTINQELKTSLRTIYSWPRSVVFIGRPHVDAGEHELEIAEKLADTLFDEYGIPVRVASRGPLLERIHSRAIVDGWEQFLQAVLRVPPGTPLANGERGLEKRAHAVILHDQSNSQFLTSTNALAYVFFPGMQGTQNRLMDIATLIQTGKMQPKPVLLVGKKFYGRIIRAMIEAMLNNPASPAMISPRDMDMFHLVDSVEEAVNELGIAGVLKKKSARSELRPAEESGGIKDLQIPLPPSGFGFHWIRKSLFGSLQLDRFARALGGGEEETKEVMDSIVRESEGLRIRLGRSRRGMIFGLEGWEKKWLEAWEERAHQDQSPLGKLQKLYLATQFPRTYLEEPVRKIQKRLFDEEFYRESRLADYQNDGRAPPRIQKIEIPPVSAAISSSLKNPLPAYLILPDVPAPHGRYDLAVLFSGLGHSKEYPYFDGLEKKLIENNMAVLRFDMPGHGENKTTVSGVKDMLRVLNRIREFVQQGGIHPEINAENMGFVGTSFGGYAVMRSAFDPEINGTLKAAVAVNVPLYHTFLNPGILLFYFAYEISQIFGNLSVEDLLRKIKAFQFNPDPSSLSRLGDPSRLLILIGAKDRLIDRRDHRLLKRIFKPHGDVIHRFPTQGHTFLEEKEGAEDLIVRHLKKAFGDGVSAVPQRAVQSRPELRASWIEEAGLRHVKNRTVVSRQMEMGLHEGLLEYITKAYGETAADDAAQSTLTGGLGALMHDLLPSWKANGIDVIGIHPIYEVIKQFPKRELSLGKYVREAILATGGRLLDAFPVELTLHDTFRARAQSSKARAVLDKKIFVRVLRTETKQYAAPQYYLDAYYLNDESLKDTDAHDGNRVRIFDEVYPDDYLWRDVQMAVYRLASERLIETLQNGSVPRHWRIKKDLIFVDNEVFVSLPREKDPDTAGRRDVKILKHHINHSVFKPTIYEPDEASYELLGFPEWIRPYITKDGKISIVDYVALTYDFFTGVSLEEHTSVLEREIFPNARHRLTGFRDRDGVRSTNGVLVEHWQSPLRQGLIRQYREKMNIPQTATDKNFYENLERAANSLLRAQFKKQNEYIKAAEVSEFLIWLAEKQGQPDWLSTALEASGRDIRALKTFQEAVRQAVVGQDIAKWRALYKRFDALRGILMRVPMVTNVRRQVPYKGPEKWLEVLLKKPLMEVFEAMGKGHTLHLLNSLLPDPILNSEKDLKRQKLSSMIGRIGQNHGEWWQELRNGFETLPVPVMNLPLFEEVRAKLALGTRAAESFKSRVGRVLIGGRTFDHAAHQNFEAIKKIVSLLNLQGHVATVENYNIREAALIFRAASGVVMLSDEFLEASATSPGKGIPNGAAIIGVWGGFMPELFHIVSGDGASIDIFESGVSHNDVRQKVADGQWQIKNGYMIPYAETERSEQDGGGRRPSAEGLEDSLIWLNSVYQNEQERAELQYEALRTTSKVNMREGQARAHAFLWERAIRAQGHEKEIVWDELQFSFQDFEKFFSLEAPRFRWQRSEREHLLTGDPGISGTVESFRRLATRGYKEQRGKDLTASLDYHAERGDLFMYFNHLLGQFSPALEPISVQLKKWAEQAERETNPSVKMKLNLQAVDFMDRLALWLAARFFEAYLNTPAEELYPDGKAMTAHQTAVNSILENRSVGKYIARYLEEVHPGAYPLTTNEAGIRAFALQHGSREIITAANAGTIAYPDHDGEKKAWGKIFYDSSFKRFLDRRQGRRNMLFKVHDYKKNRQYKFYDRDDLKAGLSIGVPGIQFLEMIPERKKPSALLSVATPKPIVSSPSTLKGALEKIKEASLQGQEVLEDLLAGDASLTRGEAEHRFGADRIPAVMALIGGLVPKYLDRMQSWNPKVHAMLKKSMERKKDIFENGDITFHTPSRDGTVAFSRSIDGGDHGKNVVIAIQFERDSRNFWDGKAWSVLRNIGSENKPLILEGNALYRVRDLLTGAAYRPHLGQNLFRHWDIGIPIQDVEWKNERVQEGLGFALLSLEKMDPRGSLEIVDSLEEKLTGGIFDTPAQEKIQEPNDLQILEMNVRAHFEEEGIGSFAEMDEGIFQEMQDFGFNTVWMMGVFEESPASRQLNQFWGDKTKTPGRVASAYAVPDYTVNKALGGEKTLRDFVSRARKNMMRVVLDFIPNHLSKDSPLIASHPDWFIHRTTPPPPREQDFYFEYVLPDKRMIWVAHGRDDKNPWQDTAQLNLINPEVWEYLRNSLHYLADLTQGGGVRVDSLQVVHPAAYRARWFPHIPPADFENHMRAISRLIFGTEPVNDSNVFGSLFAEVKAKHPDFKIIGEVYQQQHGDWQAAGVDLTYAKYVYNWIVKNEEGSWKDFKDYLFRRGFHSKVRHDYFLRSLYFLENHDERIRILEILKQRFSREFGVPKDQVDAEVIAWSKLLAVAIATMPGVPMIYMGQTEGRSRFVPSADWVPPNYWLASNAETHFDELPAFYRSLLQATLQPVFRRGGEAVEIPVIGGSPSHIVAFSRDYGSEHAIVVLNHSRGRADLLLDLPALGLDERPFSLHLEPWGYYLAVKTRSEIRDTLNNRTLDENEEPIFSRLRAKIQEDVKFLGREMIARLKESRENKKRLETGLLTAFSERMKQLERDVDELRKHADMRDPEHRRVVGQADNVMGQMRFLFGEIRQEAVPNQRSEDRRASQGVFQDPASKEFLEELTRAMEAARKVLKIHLPDSAGPETLAQKILEQTQLKIRGKKAMLYAKQYHEFAGLAYTYLMRLYLTQDTDESRRKLVRTTLEAIQADPDDQKWVEQGRIKLQIAFSRLKMWDYEKLILEVLLQEEKLSAAGRVILTQRYAELIRQQYFPVRPYMRDRVIQLLEKALPAVEQFDKNPPLEKEHWRNVLFIELAAYHYLKGTAESLKKSMEFSELILAREPHDRGAALLHFQAEKKLGYLYLAEEPRKAEKIFQGIQGDMNRFSTVYGAQISEPFKTGWKDFFKASLDFFSGRYESANEQYQKLGERYDWLRVLASYDQATALLLLGRKKEALNKVKEFFEILSNVGVELKDPGEFWNTSVFMFNREDQVRHTLALIQEILGHTELWPENPAVLKQMVLYLLSYSPLYAQEKIALALHTSVRQLIIDGKITASKWSHLKAILDGFVEKERSLAYRFIANLMWNLTGKDPALEDNMSNYLKSETEKFLSAEAMERLADYALIEGDRYRYNDHMDEFLIKFMEHMDSAFIKSRHDPLAMLDFLNDINRRLSERIKSRAALQAPVYTVMVNILSEYLKIFEISNAPQYNIFLTRLGIFFDNLKNSPTLKSFDKDSATFYFYRALGRLALEAHNREMAESAYRRSFDMLRTIQKNGGRQEAVVRSDASLYLPDFSSYVQLLLIHEKEQEAEEIMLLWAYFLQETLGQLKSENISQVEKDKIYEAWFSSIDHFTSKIWQKLIPAGSTLRRAFDEFLSLALERRIQNEKIKELLRLASAAWILRDIDGFKKIADFIEKKNFSFEGADKNSLFLAADLFMNLAHLSYERGDSAGVERAGQKAQALMDTALFFLDISEEALMKVQFEIQKNMLEIYRGNMEGAVDGMENMLKEAGDGNPSLKRLLAFYAALFYRLQGRSDEAVQMMKKTLKELPQGGARQAGFQSRKDFENYLRAQEGTARELMDMTYIMLPGEQQEKILESYYELILSEEGLSPDQLGEILQFLKRFGGEPAAEKWMAYFRQISEEKNEWVMKRDPQILHWLAETGSKKREIFLILENLIARHQRQFPNQKDARNVLQVLAKIRSSLEGGISPYDYLEIARARFASGNYEKVEEAADRGWRKLAAQEKKSLSDETKKPFEEIKEQSRRAAEVFKQLKRVYEGGEFDSAAALAEKVLKINPSDPAALRILENSRLLKEVQHLISTGSHRDRDQAHRILTSLPEARKDKGVKSAVESIEKFNKQLESVISLLEEKKYLEAAKLLSHDLQLFQEKWNIKINRLYGDIGHLYRRVELFESETKKHALGIGRQDSLRAVYEAARNLAAYPEKRSEAFGLLVERALAAFHLEKYQEAFGLARLVYELSREYESSEEALRKAQLIISHAVANLWLPDLVDAYYMISAMAQAEDLRDERERRLKKLPPKAQLEFTFTSFRMNPSGFLVSGLKEDQLKNYVWRGDTFQIKPSGQEEKLQPYFRVTSVGTDSLQFELPKASRGYDYLRNLLEDNLEKGGILIRTKNSSWILQKDMLEAIITKLKHTAMGRLDTGIPPGGLQPATTGHRMMDLVLGIRMELPGLKGEESLKKEETLVRAWIEEKEKNEHPLDLAQKEGLIQGLLSQAPFVFYQGPPGTGKTTAIVWLVEMFLKIGEESRQGTGIRILSQTNPGVDNIGRKMEERNKQRDPKSKVFFARVGNNEDVIDQEMLAIWEKRQERLDQMLKNKDAGKNTLILGTINGLPLDHEMRLRMRLRDADVVIVDEASRATVAESLLALDTFKGVKKILFVGDHKQLPAYGLSQDDVEFAKNELMIARVSQLSTPLGSRFVEDIFRPTRIKEFRISLIEKTLKLFYANNGNLFEVTKPPFHFFDTQRRSGTKIVDLINFFYNGQLKAGREVSGTVLEDDTEGSSPEEREGIDEENILNRGEINRVVNALIWLLNEQKLQPKDIAVITPYKKQVEMVTAALLEFARIHAYFKSAAEGKNEENQSREIQDFLRKSPFVSQRIRDIAKTQLSKNQEAVFFNETQKMDRLHDYRTKFTNAVEDFFNQPNPAKAEFILKSLGLGDAFIPAEEIEKGEFRVLTVDSSIGSEYKAVVASWVRSNWDPKARYIHNGRVGFLADAVDGKRRINVGMSRAQDYFIMIWDRNTFLYANDPDTREWARHNVDVFKGANRGAGKSRFRSEVRETHRLAHSVLQTLARGAELSAETAGELARRAEVKFEPLAHAFEQAAPKYAGVYASYAEDRLQGFNLPQRFKAREKELEFLRYYPDFAAARNAFVLESLLQMKQQSMEYLQADPGNRLHFAFGYRLDSSRLEEAFSSYVETVGAIKKEHPSRVQAHFRVFATKSELNDPGRKEFFKEMGRSGMVKVIELHTPSSGYQIESFLGEHPNAFLFNMPDDNLALKHQARMLDSQIEAESGFSIALLLSIKMAPVRSMTAELVKKIPDLFSPGVIEYNGISLVITPAALRFIQEAKAAQLLAQMA